MKKKYAAILVSAATLALMLCGCGGDSGSASGGSASGSDVSGSSVSSAVSSDVSSSDATVPDASGVSSSFIQEDVTERPKNSRAFMGGAMFTQMTVERNDHYEDGTYWSTDRTADGLTDIDSLCFPTDPRWLDESAMSLDPPEYVERIVHDAMNTEAYDFWGEGTGEEEAVKGDALTFYGEWNVGTNEDTKRTTAVIAIEDDYTYVYSFTAPIDQFNEMWDVYTENLDRVELVTIDR